jgi:quinol monooxygenase YgiN
VFALYQKMMAPHAEENEAQEVVAWCADQHDPDAFYLFEVYRDADSFGRNAQADWFGEFMAATGPMMAGEPTVAMASPRWSKGL